MLNDNEFMNGVWKKVNLLEWQEEEKERAFKLDKKIRNRNRKVYISVFIITALLSFSLYYNMLDKIIVLGICLGISFVGLWAALFYEFKEICEAD